MVAVGVAGKKDLYIGEFEAELFDVGADDGDGALEAGVDENVALAPGDEISGETFGAYVVEVARNAVGREGFVPIATFGTRGSSTWTTVASLRPLALQPW